VALTDGESALYLRCCQRAEAVSNVKPSDCCFGEILATICDFQTSIFLFEIET